MLRISVESVEPGAVFSKPIVNDDSIILIAAGVEVTEPLRETLITMGVTEVRVLGVQPHARRTLGKRR